MAARPYGPRPLWTTPSQVDDLIAETLAWTAAEADTAPLNPENTAHLRPDRWNKWLATLFPQYVTYDFAVHHQRFWRWLWRIMPDSSPRPFIGIWPRGGAKSSSVELGISAVAARYTRHYGLYVSGTQSQADDHVASIARMMESDLYAQAYPAAASRAIGKFGNPLGWRQNRLRTASGFTLDAVGLDVAVRGVKLEEHRPDLIVFDDIDSETDSAAAVEKKKLTLTTAILPAGAENVAVIGIQNLLHANSIFAQIADRRADFLANRILSGPIPALVEAEYQQVDGRWRIMAGRPTWEGQSLAVCQDDVTRFGLTSFRREVQHEVDETEGGMFAEIEFRHCDWKDVPPLVKIGVWVDPAVTDTDNSDSHGIQADGIAEDGTIYRLYSWEARTSPEDAMRRAIVKCIDLKGQCVGVETNQGGDTWVTVYDAAWNALVADPDYPQITERTPQPMFKSRKATVAMGSKVHRASLMLARYERGGFVHVRGTHETLERALRRFPIRKPFDLTDAAVWSADDLEAHGHEVLPL